MTSHPSQGVSAENVARAIFEQVWHKTGEAGFVRVATKEIARAMQSERIRQAREILADCEEVCAICKSAGEPLNAAGAGHCAVRIRELLKEMEAE